MDDSERVQFIEYLRQEVPDFTKRKNGYPDMRCPLNKKYYLCFKRVNHLRKNKEEALCVNCDEESGNYQDEVLKMSDKELSSFSKIEEETCVICGDVMEQDCCKLKCNHKFCVSCFAQHSRVSDKCPLCRTAMSGNDVKQIEKMDSYIASGIISEETFRSKHYVVLNDPENSYLFYEAIDREINDYSDLVMAYASGNIDKKVLDDYKVEMLKIMFINQRTMMTRAINQTCTFYNDQL